MKITGSRPRWVAAAALLAAMALVPVSAGGAEAPTVVVSIKPVHSLVAAVMEGVGEPILLIEEAGSPHFYALRPSDARALSSADIVIWVGEELETFLARPLDSLAPDARVVALMETGGVDLLPTREAGEWGAETGRDDGHAETAAEVEGEHPRHGAFDAHLWLDPRNAAAIATIVADVLIARDPENADAYRANAASLDQRLTALERSLAERLAPVRRRPFLVFHDAYQYFEHRFGLNAIGAVTGGPEIPPGAARLHALRAMIVESRVGCVFSEPQFEPRLVRTLVAGTETGTGILDPLGAALPAGPSQYFLLMEAMAKSLVDCLGGREAG